MSKKHVHWRIFLSSFGTRVILAICTAGSKLGDHWWSYALRTALEKVIDMLNMPFLVLAVTELCTTNTLVHHHSRNGGGAEHVTYSTCLDMDGCGLSFGFSPNMDKNDVYPNGIPGENIYMHQRALGKNETFLLQPQNWRSTASQLALWFRSSQQRRAGRLPWSSLTSPWQRIRPTLLHLIVLVLVVAEKLIWAWKLRIKKLCCNMLK